jgi:hypothetical protein
MDSAMSKQTHDERLEKLERDNLDLKRRVNLLELFVDSERRERSGVTTDEIRAAWRKDAGLARPHVPPTGPV